MQRAEGDLVVGLKRRGARTVLARLRQAGCLKARFPVPLCRQRADLVMLNISGGVAAGDVLATRIEAEAGARATIATQAAERCYRALSCSAPATVRNELRVADGACLEWLPQETILFDGSALDRALSVEMSDDARFLGVESLVFGRAAMGEAVRTADLRDVIRVRRGGRLLLHDAIRLRGAVQATLGREAIAARARAAATIVHVAPDASCRLDALRAALANVPAECGVSAWDRMLVARMVAPSGASLRAALVAALAILRDGRPLPRVWMC
jgi:urease accessory protein